MAEKSQNPHTIAQAKYDKEHTVRISLKLNLENDKDILPWLERQDSKQGSIKKLIRKEIERQFEEA